ncbi:MAG TPA: ABC transporter ATP-binding protein [Armatimonadota bacterium]|jgi:ABC-2 type transport system ATP-binding protein
MQPAIEITGLRKTYRSRFPRRNVHALDDVTLAVAPGEVFGYLGSNGAGKTTTVRILLGLARPSGGSARLMGRLPGGPNRSRVGYLPESPYFYDFLTPVELLTFYCRVFGISGVNRRHRIAEVLDLVGIADRRDSPLRAFSKGMTQRVGLAQALLNDPDVLFLDEPTSGLDPMGRRDIRDIILALKSRGKTVFLNSHLLSEVEQICDRVAILKAGRLMSIGTVNELISRGGVEICVRASAENLPGSASSLAVGEPTDGVLRLVVERESDTPAVLRALMDAGIEIISMNPRRETLEDVFIRIETERT